VKILTVKTAKDHIEQIKKICNDMLIFTENHRELDDETGFLCDAAGFLGDYNKVLEREIEKSELNI